MNNHILNCDKIDVFNYDNFENGLDVNEKSDNAVMMYTNYMTEIISAFVLFSEPGIQINSVLPAIKYSAFRVVKMTKIFIEVHIVTFFLLDNKLFIYILNHIIELMMNNVCY